MFLESCRSCSKAAVCSETEAMAREVKHLYSVDYYPNWYIQLGENKKLGHTGSQTLKCLHRYPSDEMGVNGVNWVNSKQPSTCTQP